MLGGSVSRGRGRPAPTKPNKTETEFRKILVGTGRGVRRAEAPPERGCFHFGLFCWRVSSTGVPLTLVFAWLVASFRTGRNGEENRERGRPARVRIPTKPARYSELMPAGIPI